MKNKVKKILLEILLTRWFWFICTVASVSNLFFEGGYLKQNSSTTFEYVLAGVLLVYWLLLFLFAPLMNRLVNVLLNIKD